MSFEEPHQAPRIIDEKSIRMILVAPAWRLVYDLILSRLYSFPKNRILLQHYYLKTVPKKSQDSTYLSLLAIDFLHD